MTHFAYNKYLCVLQFTTTYPRGPVTPPTGADGASANTVLLIKKIPTLPYANELFGDNLYNTGHRNHCKTHLQVLVRKS